MENNNQRACCKHLHFSILTHNSGYESIKVRAVAHGIGYFHSSPPTGRYQLLEQRQYRLNVHVDIDIRKPEEKQRRNRYGQIKDKFPNVAPDAMLFKVPLRPL